MFPLRRLNKEFIDRVNWLKKTLLNKNTSFKHQINHLKAN